MLSEKAWMSITENMISHLSTDSFNLKIARKRAIFTLWAVVTPQIRGDKGLTTCVVG